MTTSHFIAYGQLEEWASVADAQQPVYAQLTIERGSVASLGARTDRYAIMVAQLDAVHHVHCCRLLVGSVGYVNERPFGADHQERIEHAHQAWERVQAWLAAQGFTVRFVSVAHPRDLVLTEGTADFLEWNAETRQFRRAAARIF